MKPIKVSVKHSIHPPECPLGDPDGNFDSEIAKALSFIAGKVPGLSEGLLIVHLLAEGDEQPDTILEITPAAGEGNNCARGKMATLARYPEIANTGELAGWPDEAVDEGDIKWYGGIQLSYTRQALTVGAEERKKIMRIAYSGAREDANALISVYVLKHMMEQLRNHSPRHFYDFDLSKLLADKVSGFYMNLYSME
ncbi:hypothetical protein FWC63_03140 [Candidatus Saccharibacteria bacterium]|nr:hypothetical protein [Candidatus Saccharibacteria bacterium]